MTDINKGIMFSVGTVRSKSGQSFHSDNRSCNRFGSCPYCKCRSYDGRNRCTNCGADGVAYKITLAPIVSTISTPYATLEVDKFIATDDEGFIMKNKYLMMIMAVVALCLLIAGCEGDPDRWEVEYVCEMQMACGMDVTRLEGCMERVGGYIDECLDLVIIAGECVADSGCSGGTACQDELVEASLECSL